MSRWLFGACFALSLAGAHAHASVVINEIFVNPPGPDTGFEWVEFRNNTGGPIDLSGWRFERATSTTFAAFHTFPAGTTIAAGQHMVVGQAFVTFADQIATGTVDMGNAGSNGDAVRLVDASGTIVDTVVYGAPNDDGFVDDTGAVATSLAPRPAEGESLSRVPDGVDTDLSGDDFKRTFNLTPGLSNDVAPLDCGGPGSGVVINELLPDPPGADAGQEWVELYNASSVAVDLEGWRIEAGTSSFRVRHTFAFGVTLAPGAYLVVGGELVPEVEIVSDIELALGNATSNADAVRLADCAGLPVDTVIYGTPNTDGWVDDDGQVTENTAPKPAAGVSLARVLNGVDTNQSNVDFARESEPTPGAPNRVIEPVICEQSTGRVTINEVFPDPAGADAGKEWIELYNSGDSPASVAGWGFSAATKNFDNINVTFPGGVSIPPKGFLVIGGEFVEEADLIAVFTLGNGTGGDGVRLFDCEGDSVDTVIYGPDNDDALPDDLGVVGPPYGNPRTEQSIYRLTDGDDTNTADDWGVGSATPGASNSGSDVVAPPGGGGCCGGGAASPGGAPERGCMTAPLPLGGLELGLALVLLRRRRRSS